MDSDHLSLLIILKEKIVSFLNSTEDHYNISYALPQGSWSALPHDSPLNSIKPQKFGSHSWSSMQLWWQLYKKPSEHAQSSFWSIFLHLFIDLVGWSSPSTLPKNTLISSQHPPLPLHGRLKKKKNGKSVFQVSCQKMCTFRNLRPFHVYSNTLLPYLNTCSTLLIPEY